MIHSDPSERCVRPPGCPPSRCPGAMARVGPDGRDVPAAAPPILDDAQAGEGGPGATVRLWLYACRRCSATLAVAECRDGAGDAYFRLRNEVARRGEGAEAGGPAYEYRFRYRRTGEPDMVVPADDLAMARDQMAFARGLIEADGKGGMAAIERRPVVAWEEVERADIEARGDQ